MGEFKKFRDYFTTDQDIEADLRKLKVDNINKKKGDITEDVKLLMEHNLMEEKRILTGLGLDHNIRKYERSNGELLERKQFDNKYEGEVYTIKEIYKICVDYNLKFIQSRHYNGPISTELPSVLLRFREKYNLDIGDRTGNDNESFYICAPIECFTDGKCLNDPLIFYAVDRNKTHFKFVHKWGNSFTILRYISAFRNRNVNCSFLHWSIISTFLLSALFCLFYDTDSIWLTLTVMWILSIGAMSLIHLIWMTEPREGKAYAFSDIAWREVKNRFDRYQYQDLKRDKNDYVRINLL